MCSIFSDHPRKTNAFIGQHHILSAMVLHLRYPNAHTHWFSSLMLHLFHEVNVDKFREIMTKVLLERFLVHRPHPWGALVTFIELLRNPKYDFWNQDFIRIAPEVTLLLENVSDLHCPSYLSGTYELRIPGRKVHFPILDCHRYHVAICFIYPSVLSYPGCSHCICIVTRHVTKGVP